MDRNDVLTMAGVGILAGGLWMIYPPAALIGLGLVLVTIGMMGAWAEAQMRATKKRQERD